MGCHYDEDQEDFMHEPPMSHAEALAGEVRARGARRGEALRTGPRVKSP
jgi:hypothetical protein